MWEHFKHTDRTYREHHQLHLTETVIVEDLVVVNVPGTVLLGVLDAGCDEFAERLLSMVQFFLPCLLIVDARNTPMSNLSFSCVQ